MSVRLAALSTFPEERYRRWEGGTGALPSDMGCYNWVFVRTPNIGSLELVKAGIKKNVNNFNKCKGPFSNEALGHNNIPERDLRETDEDWLL